MHYYKLKENMNKEERFKYLDRVFKDRRSYRFYYKFDFVYTEYKELANELNREYIYNDT